MSKNTSRPLFGKIVQEITKNSRPQEHLTATSFLGQTEAERIYEKMMEDKPVREPRAKPTIRKFSWE